jgi:hypothetical protein
MFVAYAVIAWVVRPGDLSSVFAFLAGVSVGNLGRLYVAKTATRGVDTEPSVQVSASTLAKK